MKVLSRTLCLVIMVSICNVHAKKNSKESEKQDRFSKCLKIKDRTAQGHCIVASTNPIPGEWTITGVSKDPISDVPTMLAQLGSDDLQSVMSINCLEGRLAIYFDWRKALSTTDASSNPIIYRVDSNPPVDCSESSPPKKCYKWASTKRGVDIRPEKHDEFIQEIKDAKKLAVRASDASGRQNTAVFTLVDVLPTFVRIKSKCVINGAADKEGPK